MSQDKDPTRPAEPADAADPADPTDAGDPAGAADPTYAAAPADATDPTDAQQPSGGTGDAGIAPVVPTQDADMAPATPDAPPPRRPRDRPLPPEIEARWTGTGAPTSAPATWTPSPHRIQDDYQRAPFFNASMLVMFMAVAALFALGVYLAVSKYGLGSLFSR